MKSWKAVLMGAVLIAPSAFARGDANAKDETKRLENAGTVMDEVLNVPDDIPQDLLNKARCVVVLPSVVKAAFIVGGSYGRGTMVCRTGKGLQVACAIGHDHACVLVAGRAETQVA